MKKIFQFENDLFVQDVITTMSQGLSNSSDSTYEELSKCFYNPEKYKMQLTVDEQYICVVFIERD